jgi:glucose-1-phosphate cytidylyltransferase
MKTVILAGGLGTRLSEETGVRPKPMVEIGGRPMLWHIMSIYARSGFSEFVVACGYKGELIKQYFADFFHHHSDWTVDLSTGERTVVGQRTPDWRVHLVDTGLETMTAGRVYNLRDQLRDAPFMLTYGDGLSDIDVAALVAFHRSHGKLATVTAVHPQARFGAIDLDGDAVVRFAEKPQIDVGWINGGFFVFEPGALDYLRPDSVLEREPLEGLAAAGRLTAYRHSGFWRCMDTYKDAVALNDLWAAGEAPWTRVRS